MEVRTFMSSTVDACVGRQPIYDRRRSIVAYELLFRTPGAARALSNGDAATAQVVLNTVVEIGLDRISGGLPVFLNCTRNFLENGPVIPPDLCVLEVLESLSPDKALVEDVKRLRATGYRIALDDFIYRPEWKPLVELATYIKLDVRAQERDALGESVRQLRRFRATLLAEKVESEEEMEFCAGLGFELFQGYYLRRPETVTARRAPLSNLALLMVQRLADPKTTVDQITHIIAEDAAMTFRILRLANSARLGQMARIESVRQAVMSVGVNTVLQWALMMVMAGITGCPTGYLETALHRARTCELLAERETQVRGDQAYLVGLLSLLDSMLEAPLDSIVGPLPLADEILRALLHRQGHLGCLLAAVESYESGEPNVEIQKAFWDGADYARRVMQSVSTALA